MTRLRSFSQQKPILINPIATHPLIRARAHIFPPSSLETDHIQVYRSRGAVKIPISEWIRDGRPNGLPNRRNSTTTVAFAPDSHELNPFSFLLSLSSPSFLFFSFFLSFFLSSFNIYFPHDTVYESVGGSGSAPLRSRRSTTIGSRRNAYIRLSPVTRIISSSLC